MSTQSNPTDLSVAPDPQDAPQERMPADLRAAAMERYFRQGESLERVGQRFGVTRERVRQILQERGVTRDQGGEALQALRREAERKKARQQRQQARHQLLSDWCREALGCTIEEAVRINGGKPVTNRLSSKAKGNAYNKYLGIRNQAHRKNPEKPYLSLSDWYQAWVRSGHWKNGPTQGWCLIRVDPEGPWALNNVQVVRAGSWMSLSRLPKNDLTNIQKG